MRTEFANICLDVVKKDPKAVIFLGDISHFLLRDAQSAAPDRVHNIGICEQAMVNIAAGTSLEGMRPIVHTIAPFLVERAYEQIKVGIGYQQTEVTIITVGGTYDYSDLGCTHHCYGDIALMRTIPNMDVYEPGTSAEFRSLFEQTWGNGKSKYFRLSAKAHSQNFLVTPEEVNVLRESTINKYVFVTGHLLDSVMEIPGVGIIYVPTLSRISRNSVDAINKLIDCNTKLYSVEIHFINGGLGDYISEILNRGVHRIGINRQFVTEYGSYDDMLKSAGLDLQSILNKIGND